MTPAAEGRKAGLALLSPSVNPFADSDPRSVEWDREWRAASAQIIFERDAERRRRAGCLAAEPCSEIGT